MLGQEGRRVGEVAGLPRGLDHAPHRTAHEAGLAVVGRRRMRDGLNPRDVARKAGNCHAPGALGDNVGEALPKRALRTGAAVHHGVGGIDHQGADAFPAQRAQPVHIGLRPHQGRGIELPVGRVHGQSRLGANCQHVSLGNRMRSGEEFDLERAGLEALVRGDGAERHVVQAGLGELPPQDRRGERGRVDRAPQLGPENGNRAQMVLVRMRHHDGFERVASFHDEAGIGNEDVHSRRRLVAESDPQIHHQPAPVGTVEIEVHADLAGAAECDEEQFVPARHQRRHAVRFRRHIEARPRSVISESTSRITGVPSAKSGASPPVAMTFMSVPNSSTMRATSPSISPT